MVDTGVILAAVAGVGVLGAIGLAIGLTRSAYSDISSKEVESGIGPEGDSEFYSRGGKSKKRSRKHKKKTIRRNK